MTSEDIQRNIHSIIDDDGDELYGTLFMQK